MLARLAVSAAIAIHAVGLVACAPPAATLLSEVPDAHDVGPDADRYRLTAENTVVEAEISAGATFTLGFATLEGTLSIHPDDPTRVRLEVTVDATSATSSIDRVAEIAMSDHFLDAASFPTASFATRTMTRLDDGYEAVAMLDLHGVERGLRTPTRITITPCTVGLDIAFSFDRHAFAMQTEGTLETMVSDTVAVIIRVEVARPCTNGEAA